MEIEVERSPVVTAEEPPELSRIVDAAGVARLASQATGWYFEPDVSYPAELDSLVDPELISRFAIVGAPGECLAGLKSLARMGFRSVRMNVAAVRRPGTSMYHGLRETLQGLAEITPQVHAL